MQEKGRVRSAPAGGGGRGRLVLESAGEVPVVVVASRAASRTAIQSLESAGVDVIVASGGNEAARTGSALEQLGSRGVQSLLLEGGPHLAGAFLDAGEIDEIRLFLAPLVLGGRSARATLEGEGAVSIADAARALTLSCERVGDDLMVSARLREW